MVVWSETEKVAYFVVIGFICHTKEAEMLLMQWGLSCHHHVLPSYFGLYALYEIPPDFRNLFPAFLKGKCSLQFCNEKHTFFGTYRSSTTKFGKKWWTGMHTCLERPSPWWLFLLYPSLTPLPVTNSSADCTIFINGVTCLFNRLCCCSLPLSQL